jgi:hypothetical protein
MSYPAADERQPPPRVAGSTFAVNPGAEAAALTADTPAFASTEGPLDLENTCGG